LNENEKKWKRYVESMEKVAREIHRQDERGRIEQAKIDGKIEGLKEGKIDTAKNMLKMKFDNETIQKATGLPLEEISRINLDE